MQRIEATFPTEYLEDVMKDVLSLRIPCTMTASEVRYADETTSQELEYRGRRYTVPWETRTRLEIVVSDKEAESVLGLLVARLDVDRRQDGVVLVSEVPDALRIRTARRGSFAF